jgi:hypothetical protein
VVRQGSARPQENKQHLCLKSNRQNQTGEIFFFSKNQTKTRMVLMHLALNSTAMWVEGKKGRFFNFKTFIWVDFITGRYQ